MEDGASVGAAVGEEVSGTAAPVLSQSPRSKLQAIVLHSALHVESPSQVSGHAQTKTGGSVTTEAQSPPSNRHAVFMHTRSQFLSPRYRSRQPGAHIFSVGGSVGASVIRYDGGSVLGCAVQVSPSQPSSHVQSPVARLHEP